MFTKKGYAIYVLDDYSIYLMPEVRQALLKKGYVLVVIGGGITGDIQINDTSCHHNLKKHREFEMNLMLEQLNNDPNKIPSPSRDEMMRMLLKAWELLDVDTEREFKSLFVTNALDGSEDYLVSDKLYALVGNEMVKFRTELMTSRPAKTLKEVIRKLIPPKGVKRKGNDEGIELLDCEEEEIPLEELEQECDDELCDDDEVENDNVVAEENHDQIGLITISSASKKETSLLSFTSDPEIKKDAEFLDKFQQIMEDSGTSKLFIPYMSQFRATFQKARRSIKKRIETKASANPQLSKKDNVELPVEGPLNNVEAATQPMEPATKSNRDETALNVPIDGSSEDLDIGQYWEISIGKDLIYAQVVEKDNFMVLREDFVQKVQEPQLIAVGRSRVNYFLNRKHF